MIIDKNERIELAAKLGIQCNYDALFQLAERVTKQQELSFYQIAFSQGRYHADVTVVNDKDCGQVYWCDDDDPFVALASAIAEALEEGDPE